METTWDNVGKIVDEAIEFLAKRLDKMSVGVSRSDRDELAESLYMAIFNSDFSKVFEGEAYSE